MQGRSADGVRTHAEARGRSRAKVCSRLRLLDYEGALHPASLMPRDRAVELIGARLEVDGDLRGAALANPRPLLAHAVALDRDVVGDRSHVGHHERDLAGL